MQTELQLTGIGLRAPHLQHFLQQQPKVAWVEVHSENYFAEGGKSLQQIEQVRQNYPISLHGVGLSIASADELNWHHLKNLQQLIARINPCLVSDHLAWVSIEGQYLHDLLPVPYTHEALQHIVDRIQQVQTYLKRQILIENISSYIEYECSEFTEWSFLKEVAQRSGCGILLDINNIYVNAMNFNFDPEVYLAEIPAALIQEIHLGGFTITEVAGKQTLIDTHSQPIVPAVWALYKTAIQQIGTKATIIEWDKNLPALETLCLEAYRAEKIMRENYGFAKRTA